jgi:hypothetical protein
MLERYFRPLHMQDAHGELEGSSEQRGKQKTLV